MVKMTVLGISIFIFLKMKETTKKNKTILKWILQKDRMGWYGMDWIDLAEDRDQWRALLNTVMNLRGPLDAGKYLSGCKIGSF
jgi:hypothetical protein